MNTDFILMEEYGLKDASELEFIKSRLGSKNRLCGSQRRKVREYRKLLCETPDSIYCYHCKKGPLLKLKKGSPDLLLTIDHLIPISKGGKNNTSNFVVSCRKCNSRKADSIW